ncbi:alpha/beta fold hydrolase [Streptomyces sp. NPDC058280]|uniref:alpha/beta fold hydrolase n=1 Tax=Streptomyces sp. NPDC058280 TaxID=3346419 RepID=UPI0036EAB3DE
MRDTATAAAATAAAATAAATTAAVTATTRTVVSDGVRLACTDHGGTGRPVLLLHGLAGHTAEWDSLARLLLPAHRVVAYDARGHGASDRHPTDGMSSPSSDNSPWTAPSSSASPSAV